MCWFQNFFYKLQVVVMWRNVQTRYTAFSTAAVFTRRCSSADSMAAKASNLINHQRNKGGHNKDYARPVPWYWNGRVLVPSRWTIMEQGTYILKRWLIINNIHNTNFIKQSWNLVQNGFQTGSSSLQGWNWATIPCPGLQMYCSEFGGLQGRAIASYFKVVWPKCTSACGI